LRFDVLLGAAAAAAAFDRAADADGGGGGRGGVGDARRLALLLPALGGRPTLFFTDAAAAGLAFSTASRSGSGAVLTRFDPRVKRKSPSCSSYTDAAVSHCQSLSLCFCARDDRKSLSLPEKTEPTRKAFTSALRLVAHIQD
jgi:hypothetical protein